MKRKERENYRNSRKIGDMKENIERVVEVIEK